MHRHHIIPKHLGGDDSEDNLTPPISIGLHALFHKDLWDKLGHVQDYIAWQALSGRITPERARLDAAKIGQDKSDRYKASRKSTAQYLKATRTKENCSAGGKAAIRALNKWKNDNRQQFLEQCSINGKVNSQKLRIMHEFNGVIYDSKKDLQKATGIYNNAFYKKLKSGEIKRLGRMASLGQSNAQAAEKDDAVRL